MKKFRISTITLSIVLCAQLFSGCGKKAEVETTTEATTVETATDATTEATTEAHVATASDVATKSDTDEKKLVPITADQIEDGVYDITVESSSNMFNIVACELTVSDGQMTAKMTMGGTGYKYVYMGTIEEAEKDSEDKYIDFEELESGEHTFTVPVEALDKEIDCAAFSKKKEKWYDRVLIFKSDSIDPNAITSSNPDEVAVSELGLEDGEYTISVTLEGGSGKTTVESPAKIIVTEGKAKAVIVFSSKNYDYVIYNDVKMFNEAAEDQNSTFTIDVDTFNKKLPIIGDTVAMSEPHEISYTLFFDKNSLVKEK